MLGGTKENNTEGVIDLPCRQISNSFKRNKKGLVGRPGQRLRNAPAKLLQDVLVVSFAVKYLKHQEKTKKSVFIYE